MIEKNPLEERLRKRENNNKKPKRSWVLQFHVLRWLLTTGMHDRWPLHSVGFISNFVSI